MTTTDTPVDTICGCGQPTRDHATICDRCVTRLTRRLAELPAHLHDLEDTITRQTTTHTTHTRTPNNHPLPINLPAAELATHARHTLAVIATRLGAPHQPPTTPNRQATTTYATTIVERINAIRFWHDANDTYNDITHITRNITHAIDKPLNRLYAGVCSTPLTNDTNPPRCPHELYAHPRHKTITCPQCGTTHNVAERRDTLLIALRDTLAPARDIALGVGELLGRHINLTTVRSWRRRHRLTPATTSPDGTELYRVGDVIDLALAHAQTKP